MKEPVKEPQKIKIVVKPGGGAVVKKPVVKEEPIKDQQKPKPIKKKSILRRIGEIVSNDLHNIPTKLWGEKKKVIMPDSKESWKDWEGEL
jgi:hypothetical protein